jgi:hypothetical protein
MNSIAAPGRPSRSGNKPHAARCVSACLAASLFLTSAQGAAQEPVAAVWQSRKLSFSYSSATTVFSCSALASRVASILRAVGARDDLKVKATGCSESIIPPFSPVKTGGVNSNPGGVNSRREVSYPFREQGTDERQLVSVHVKMMLPTEVTPDVLAELKKDKSRRELVSRVTGNPAARFNDPILFSAQWEPVTLSRKTIGIETEECELLEQMSPGVFRDLGMRVIRSGVSCSPDSRIPPEVVVEALRPTKFESGAAPAAPPGTEDDADPSAPATSNDDSGKDAEAGRANE